MKHTQAIDKRAGINNIARSQGTNKMDPVYYNQNAPHNQPFNKPAKKSKA